jgi:phosphate transport system substrate-binding protein
VQVPVDLGAVAVAYNAITNGGGPLKLTGPVIARIFLGQINKWDDPAIQALNPGTQLPDAYITVVHRSDGSGTTYIFSNYLSTVSPAWASAVGTGRSLHWPVGYAADLGYVPLPPAVQQLATTTLARVTGPAGQPLTG